MDRAPEELPGATSMTEFTCGTGGKHELKFNELKSSALRIMGHARKHGCITRPEAEPASGVTRVAPQRDYYIDRLRSVMTALVLLHHTAITYGAPGGWFYNELYPSTKPSSILLTLFVSTNQAYFMGFFFLLAGYFTPASLERKGYARFLGDRFLRLGLPLLAFIFVLGPLTAAMVAAYEGKGFWRCFPVSLESHDHHQRSAVVRAGAADVLPGLLRMACSIGRSALAVRANTVTSSLLLATGCSAP